MYSFAQRSDTRVIDEPLYAHYLYKTNADHPGKEEVLASMEKDGNKVIKEIILGNYNEEIIFMKLILLLTKKSKKLLSLV